MNIIKAIENLKISVLDDNYDTVKKPIKDLDIPIYDRGDHIIIGLEGSDGYNLADYYGEYRGGYPWVNPALEELVKKHWDIVQWQNPGALYICK